MAWPGPAETWREIQELREQVESVFREARTAATGAAAWRPPLDLSSDREAYFIEVDLPGVSAEEITLRLSEGILWLSGQKTAGSREGQAVREERRYGRFAVAVPLPRDADSGAIAARLQQGVLTVRVGRRSVGADRVLPVEEISE